MPRRWAWAEADLAATTKPWKVALYHRSIYSAGGENGSELPVREVFGPLFDKHGVHLALSAHEHDYERTKPLRAGVVDATGTTYVVSGGGGGPLYPAGVAEWTAKSASVHHDVRGTATPCTLRLDAIGLDGLSFDGATLQRCPLPADTAPPQVAITTPSANATVKGNQPVVVSASDDVGVTSVELYVDGALAATDHQPPFSFSWDTTTAANGTHQLTARALDAAGHMTTSTPVTVDVQNPVAGSGDIVLYAADATVLRGRWQKEADLTAAGGFRLRNPDAGAAKRTSALASPTDYFELDVHRAAQRAIPVLDARARPTPTSEQRLGLPAVQRDERQRDRHDRRGRVQPRGLLGLPGRRVGLATTPGAPVSRRTRSSSPPRVRIRCGCRCAKTGCRSTRSASLDPRSSTRQRRAR